MPRLQFLSRRGGQTHSDVARRRRLGAAVSGLTAALAFLAFVQPASAFSLVGVRKQIINNTGLPTPAGPYQVQVDCSPAGPHTIVSLTSPGALQQNLQVQAGSVCAIAELTPPQPPRKDCRWYVSYPDGQKVRAGEIGKVVNELKCDGGGKSTVSVIKRIVNNTGLPTPAGPYQMQVNCSPNGPNTTVSLTSPNNLQQTISVPTGSVCSIVELPPPTPRKDCRWLVSYPNGERVRDGGTEVVVNELKCGDNPGARLTVRKLIVNNSPVAAPAGPYQVQVSCTPNGPNTTVSLTSPNNLQQTLPLPAGSVCSIVELPPPPSPLSACRWSVSYPNGQTGLTGGYADVVNKLTCS